MVPFIEGEELKRLLPYEKLIPQLRSAFAKKEITAPARQHHEISREAEKDRTLLLMPAWNQEGDTGIKIVTVNPDNEKRHLPSVQGLYLLLDGLDSAPCALMDGAALTLRRTAAASALAASFLSRADSHVMLMVGTGSLCLPLIEAHSYIRKFDHILIWGRNPDKAGKKAEEASAMGWKAQAVDDLQSAAAQADHISCATLSQRPLIQGKWLKPGMHLDLVGGFTPAMREADDEVIQSSSLFVDTYEGALAEAGDILMPLEAGLIGKEDIQADLSALCQGIHPGRRSYTERTLFKSVGTALEDFVAARLAYSIRNQISTK